MISTAALLLATGCSDDQFPLVSVSGRVTLDGEALAGALVGFEPSASPGQMLAGPGSFARTDSQGNYELVAVDKRRGAVAGKHRVTIRTFLAETTPTGETKILVNETLPTRYHSRSELTIEISADGTDSADFALQSK